MRLPADETRTEHRICPPREDRLEQRPILGGIYSRLASYITVTCTARASLKGVPPMIRMASFTLLAALL
jgi:hypothetical protein